MRLRKRPALIGVAISTMAVLFSNSPSAGYLLVGGGRTGVDVLRFDETTGAFIDVFIPLNSFVTEIAFGPDGALYMPLPFDGDVVRFNGFTGAFLGVFVPKGSGGLAFPKRVVFGPDCSLYVADPYFAATSTAVLRYQGKTGDFADRRGAAASQASPTWSSARMAICTWPPGRIFSATTEGPERSSVHSSRTCQASSAILPSDRMATSTRRH